MAENKIIKISLEGGLIQDVGDIPSDVRVRVRDYDVEGADDEEIITDENGKECFESWWHPETGCQSSSFELKAGRSKTCSRMVNEDGSCVTCDETHGQCSMPDCGHYTYCPPDEKGEPFTVCECCDAVMP
jgi:hypothetical protein